MCVLKYTPTSNFMEAVRQIVTIVLLLPVLMSVATGLVVHADTLLHPERPSSLGTTIVEPRLAMPGATMINGIEDPTADLGFDPNNLDYRRYRDHCNLYPLTESPFPPNSPPSVPGIEGTLETTGTSGLPDGTPILTRLPLTKILDNCPSLRNKVNWTDGQGHRHNITDWDQDMKDRIDEIFDGLMGALPDLGLKCVDTSRAYCAPGICKQQHGSPFFSRDEAFDIYAAHVAHVFYLEVAQKVHWSILDAGAELDEILDSTRYFSHLLTTQGYDQNPQDYYPPHIQPQRDFTQIYESDNDNALICDPRDGYRFALANQLLGTTERETLERLSFWMFRNLTHQDRVFAKPYPQHLRNVGDNNSLAKRLLPNNNSAFVPAVNGCHGASDLLRDLARSVNIPLLRLRLPDPAWMKNMLSGKFPLLSGSHGALCWKWKSAEARCVPHLDDLYEKPSTAVKTGAGIYPLKGRKLLSPAERVRTYFFETLWQTPAFLRKSGFNYKIAKVSKGIGYGSFYEGVKHFPNLGYILGDWALSDRERVKQRNAQIDPQTGYYLEPAATKDLWRRYEADYFYRLVPEYNYLGHFCAGLRPFEQKADYCKKSFKGAVYDHWIGVIANALQSCLATAATESDEQRCHYKHDSDVALEDSRLQQEYAKCERKYLSDANLLAGYMESVPYYAVFTPDTGSSLLNLGFQPTKQDILQRLKQAAHLTRCQF